jgi:hypothetical protein
MKRIILAMLFTLSGTMALADIYDDVIQAFQSGNAGNIVRFFDNTIDLSLEGLAEEDIYPRVKGEQLIREFFTKHPVKSFSIIHKGSSKEGTKFGIASLVTTDGLSYRVNFMIKSSSGQNFLQSLKIEKQ